ncbi:hypothetical protein [Rubrivirga sp. IMCC45206]|uniref:hypothetical protein n=1 Tax=Rubrivirga sp. IMCC45206 TaxID=3391614 RepID=UPI0039902DBE
MILRRITQHVKDQNWTAVAIDFVIVVVGVFIGTQVSNLNEARKDRARAAVYSERLRAELRTEFVYTRALTAYYDSLHHASDLAYRGLTGQTPLDDQALLANAYRATQYNWYERRRAAFDQIVSSGAMALISDVALREAAIGMYTTPVFGLIVEEGEAAAYRSLFRMTIEPSLHDDLGRNCGDQEVASDEVDGVLLVIGGPCPLDSSPEELAAGVRALQSDPEIVRTLRLRQAQLGVRVYDLDFTLRTYGLYTLFGEGATP